MKVYKVPLRLEPQPEGGFTVTSPALRGLVTEGETVAEALAHAAEALELVLEDYEAEGMSLPEGLRQGCCQLVACRHNQLAGRRMTA
jgi:antitoxin HicB